MVLASNYLTWPHSHFLGVYIAHFSCPSPCFICLVSKAVMAIEPTVWNKTVTWDTAVGPGSSPAQPVNMYVDAVASY